MKALKTILLSLLALLVLGVGIGYYTLLRPYENIAPSEQLSFNEIEPTANGIYPVQVYNIDSLKEQVTIERGIWITLEDGVKLSANIFQPKTGGPFPVVLSFTAYDKDKGPDQYPPPLKAAYLDEHKFETIKVSPWTMWEAPDPAFWLSNGYAVVQVDSRGYFSSEGDASLFDAQNIKDFHEVIRWAGTQSWSNGNVGLNGVSYLAIAQWFAASNNPPEQLKAIIPWEGNNDPFREVLYHGGIPETVFTTFWVNRVRACANEVKPLPPFPVFKLGHKNPWLLKKLQDPPVLDLAEIQVPALICATWSDQGLHSRGSFEGYKKISSTNKWLFTHGREKWSTYYSEEALAYQKNFFDHFLKGEANGFDTIPSVRLEVRESLDSFIVRYEDSYPIPTTIYESWYLNANNQQLEITPPATESTIEYDPMNEQAVFNYTFNEDTELSGNMKLKLWVSTSKGSDMDLHVAVKKLDRQGEEVHFYLKTGFTQGPVALGWLRVSERELDKKLSKPWQPVLTQ
ncbi:MAG: CocE/NonD family hydrolase, partial [Bacteroidota bacterium]